LLLACGSGCASTPSAGLPLRSPLPAGTPLTRPVQTIVIDAGHGGHDPGTSHHGLKEKHLALDIARRLRSALQDAGLTVVMTRDSDEFLPLSRRPGIANRADADLFVSVHINANRSRRVSGIEVYYPRVSVVSSSAHWPPSVSPSEVGVSSATVKQVLWDLVLGRTRSQSRRLASAICRTMREDLQVHCRGVKPARFVVLREAWMPAVLVEVGYLSNQAEAQRLGTAAYRQAAARAIAGGIIAYIRGLGAQHI
jgi:N-acetylmuramoyl-L-alanine amidase